MPLTKVHSILVNIWEVSRRWFRARCPKKGCAARDQSLTENGSVDDISVGESDFDGMLLVSNAVYLHWDDLVGKDDVSIGVKDHLEAEGADQRPSVQL